MQSSYQIAQDGSYSVIYEVRYIIKTPENLVQMKKIQLGSSNKTELMEVQVVNANGKEEKKSYSMQENTILFENLKLNQQIYLKYRCEFPPHKEIKNLFSVLIDSEEFTFPMDPVLKVTKTTEQNHHFKTKSKSELFVSKWDPSQALVIKDNKEDKKNRKKKKKKKKAKTEGLRDLSAYSNPQKGRKQKYLLQVSNRSSWESLSVFYHTKLKQSLSKFKKITPMKDLVEKTGKRKDLQSKLDFLLHSLLSQLQPLPEYKMQQWEKMRSYSLIFNEVQKPLTPVENTLLLLALLRSLSVDFEVYLSLSSSMEKMESPLPNNHFIRLLIKVKDKENSFWVDPSLPFVALDHLPQVKRNEKALLIFPDKGKELAKLFSSFNPYSFISIEQEVSIENLLNGEAAIKGKGQMAGNILLSFYKENKNKELSFLEKSIQKHLFFNERLDAFTLLDLPSLGINVPNEMSLHFDYKVGQRILRTEKQVSYLILPYFILNRFIEYDKKIVQGDGTLKYQKKTLFSQQPDNFSTNLECKVSSPWLSLKREILPFSSIKNESKNKNKKDGAILWEWFFIKSKKVSLEDQKGKAYGDFIFQLKKCISYSSLIFYKNP